jgi:homoserine O-acetyltransferase
VNALGNGLSASPSNSERQPGHAFPVFTVRDMVASQARLLDALGIDRLALVAGASMGGMQALQWGVSHPSRMDRIVALSPLARTPGWSAVVNEAARRALQALVSPQTWTARQHPASAWEAWALVMQVLAVRTPAQVDSMIHDAAALKPWLAQCAQEWAERGFDPLDWLYQSLAYDAHDVGTTPGWHGDTAAALASIRVPTLILGASLDLYNPVACAEWAARQIPGCTYAEIASDWGHRTFSAADTGNAALLRQHLSQFLWASEGKSKS